MSVLRNGHNAQRETPIVLCKVSWRNNILKEIHVDTTIYTLGDGLTFSTVFSTGGRCVCLTSRIETELRTVL